jgi:hypothetical protein
VRQVICEHYILNILFRRVVTNYENLGAASLEFAIRKVQENQARLKLNGTHRLLVCVDDVNLLGDNIDTIKKNTETLIDSSKEVGLEVNAEKTKYMLLSHLQNAGQTHVINMANRCFENVTQFKFLERL